MLLRIKQPKFRRENFVCFLVLDDDWLELFAPYSQPTPAMEAMVFNAVLASFS